MAAKKKINSKNIGTAKKATVSKDANIASKVKEANKVQKDKATEVVKKDNATGAVKAGDKVKVEYTGTFDDGTVFDSSEKHGKPLEFEAGKGMVIKGFDGAIIGMKKGEEKSIHINPKEAYGDKNPMLVKKVPKEHLPQDREVKAGMMLAVGLPNGQQLPAMITAVDDKEVTIDLNHPLAGKALNFKIKVVGIN